MKCRLINVIYYVGLALCVPTVSYALAPVTDASTQTQGVESGELVPSTDTAQSTATDTAPVSNNPTPATAQQQPQTGNTTDNNPLIGSSNLSNAAPTLQNPSIGGGVNSALSSLPLSARVGRLEQQMQNIMHANLAAQVSSLQQQIQQLSGELQVQQHDIKLLNQQLRNFYQDLSTQIKQLKNMSSSSDDTTTSPPPSSSPNKTLPSSNLPPVNPPPPTTPKKQTNTSLNTPANANDFAAHASNKYKTALNLLMNKKYDLAAHDFNDYVNNYPNGRFVVNAHYWLGEIAVMQRNLRSAVDQFNLVIKHPHSDKVPDAKVKLAIIHASQGRVSQARGEFMKIKQQYPGTTAAQLAEIQLQQLDHS